MGGSVALPDSGQSPAAGAIATDVNLLELMPDAVFVVAADGRIVQANRQCSRLFGFETPELIGQSIDILVPPRLRVHHARHRAGYGEKPGMRQMGAGLELRGHHKDGREIPVDIMLSPLPHGGGTLAVIRDISEICKANERLERLAYEDSLTGTGNRAALYRHLEQMTRAGIFESPFAVALFDLDGFKSINDTLGHSAGDELLRAAVVRGKSALADLPTPYRLGGDEFMLVIPGCETRDEAIAVAGRVQRMLADPFVVAGHTVQIGACAGIALAPSDGREAETLISNADLALYEAKAKGDGSACVFHPKMRTEVESRERLRARLRDARYNGDFEIFYQPIVRMSDSAIVGAEALLRLHDRGRVIAPGAFMQVLENSPIAGEIGDWIVSEACTATAAVRASGHADFWCAVNVFAAQLEDCGFAEKIEALLQSHRLSTGALHIEITENIALQHNGAIRAALDQLSDAGVPLAFDDFGTGYASLSLLTEIPLTHLKIDRNFVRRLSTCKTRSAIVRSLVRLAQELEITVIAEGVETTGQERLLRSIGCHKAQGFLYGRPMPLGELERRLQSQHDQPHRSTCAGLGS